MLWLQLIAFPLLAVGGIRLGIWSARQKNWWIPVTTAFILIALVIFGVRTERLHFLPPFSWLVNLRINPPLMTACISVLLTILLLKLPQRRTRYLVATAMAVMLLVYGLFPVIMPLAARATLLSTPTLIDRLGVCRQRHGFTCGPAAAVTCLARLGIKADEGPIAVAAHCGPGVGADGWALASAMNTAAPGHHFTYRYAARPEDLTLPAVADMNMQSVGGHYIALLAIDGNDILVGDPLTGFDRMPRSEFMSQWKHGAIEKSH